MSGRPWTILDDSGPLESDQIERKSNGSVGRGASSKIGYKNGNPFSPGAAWSLSLPHGLFIHVSDAIAKCHRDMLKRGKDEEIVTLRAL